MIKLEPKDDTVETSQFDEQSVSNTNDPMDQSMESEGGKIIKKDIKSTYLNFCIVFFFIGIL